MLKARSSSAIIRGTDSSATGHKNKRVVYTESSIMEPSEYNGQNDSETMNAREKRRYVSLMSMY